MPRTIARSRQMSFAIFLGKSIATILLLTPQMLLVAMTSDPPLGLVVVALWGFYSWVVIRLYADLKARHQVDFWANLALLPLLVPTSTFGFILWFIFRFEQRRKAWYQRQQANFESRH